ncbi:hypothetical protein [Paractinoplanes durhamensis]|uniref:DUF2892 domain-containing protein n=1 Tax=Paractinoplanes durhamensis TaxID=113563 RepID=A0ABQ3ZBF1_9ACTN|nr:hypothetical protein [Actinoplanes durhamensis]GIE07140.1 hypothetical protein Adu01nite_84900 [Actinoplanes durhamensis]
MDFPWDPVDQPTEPSTTAVRSGRGVLQAVLSGVGWLLLIPAWWLAETPLLAGSLVGWSISLLAVSFAASRPRCPIVLGLQIGTAHCHSRCAEAFMINTAFRMLGPQRGWKAPTSWKLC